MEPEIVTRHLQGTSDLTLIAKINPGLIPTLDTRTYLTRLRAVLTTLHTFRQTSREHSLVRPFSDSTDRIRTITDLRMAILEDEHKLLLSVTFDRPWEPYLRIIWRDVGTLLDLIFCNCEKYPISFSNSFATYGAWIREARTNTKFFYKPSALTFDDAQYLRQTEKLLSDIPESDLQAAKLVVSDPARVAMDNAINYPGLTVRQGMQALSVLYRLADVYPPGTNDGHVLLRASRELLRELMPVLNNLPAPVYALVYKRFKAQLDWFTSPPQQRPPRPPFAGPPNTKDVQGGILSGYKDVTHGCVLLIRVDDPVAAADFLLALGGIVYTEGAAAPANGIYVNVAFTPEGLRALGLTQADMDVFPYEFIEGMQERAGLIGDVRGNHPRNWALPERNWPMGPAPVPPELVQLSTVHIVVQVCMKSNLSGSGLIAPLQAQVQALMAAHPNVQLLSVQPMRRHYDPTLNQAREHFGFIDSISQPVVGQRQPSLAWSNVIGIGEVLLGYRNDRGDDPVPNPLCDNGSFLVIRKLRQDVAALNAVVRASGIEPDVLKAKMVGRTVDGEPLARPASGNAFDYQGDRDGSRCPFTAHIRRANPRTGDSNVDSTPTVPRIMRRGMSYGPRFEQQPEAERGLMFMCYNASIAEQFEIIQRWISGGNSTGVLSEHSDALLGVPQLGEVRSFRYHDGTGVTRVKLDDALDNPRRPFVRLEWGLYLFAPSTTALAMLEQKARAYVRPFYVRPVNMPVYKDAAYGELIIKNLQEQEKLAVTQADKDKVSDLWKDVLEDSQRRAYGDSEAVWAAIRKYHGGVLRTFYGVLAGSRALVQKVLDESSTNYTVGGYVPRLRPSIGEMYLDLDDTGAGCPYRQQSAVTNTAIMAVRQADAFALAYQHTAFFLKNFLIGPTKAVAQGAGDSTWELTFDIKEVSDYTLARLCEVWFSLKNDSNPFSAGGSPWDWQPGQPPYYPGHFTAPSRYVFQPNPGPGATQLGQLRGTALLTAMTQFVAAWRASGNVPPGAIVSPMFNDANLSGGDLLARTILGTLIGFLPTVEGNFRATLNEWLEERTLWDLQSDYVKNSGATPYDKAKNVLLEPLMHTMQFRPAPEISWRKPMPGITPQLGTEQIGPKDIVVIGIVSATQEALSNRVTDVYPIFGGNRRSGGAHPTHACPGYEIGIGVLLGMLAALMEIGPVRPTPAPLTLELRGTLR